MTLEVFINGKEIVKLAASWNSSGSANIANQFHDLARIAHHAIDKSFKDLSTVKLTVKQEGGAK